MVLYLFDMHPYSTLAPRKAKPPMKSNANLESETSYDNDALTREAPFAALAALSGRKLDPAHMFIACVGQLASTNALLRNSCQALFEALHLSSLLATC